MSKLIERVFIDGKYQYGGLRYSEFIQLRDEYRRNAIAIMEQTNADHVVYAAIEYDEASEIEVVRLYSGLVYNDKQFNKDMGELSRDFWIGAVHKHGIIEEDWV